MNYIRDYVTFSPHFGGERYFSESIVGFYTLYLMANTFSVSRSTACFLGPVEVPAKKRVERAGREMWALKYWSIPAKPEHGKSEKKKPNSNPNPTLNNSCYILCKMLKIQLFLFPHPLLISFPFISLPLPKYFILPFKSVIIFLSKQN